MPEGFICEKRTDSEDDAEIYHLSPSGGEALPGDTMKESQKEGSVATTYLKQIELAAGSLFAEHLD